MTMMIIGEEGKDERQREEEQRFVRYTIIYMIFDGLPQDFPRIIYN
jgi:hypothetical protein